MAVALATPVPPVSCQDSICVLFLRHQPPMKAAREVGHRRQPVRWRRSCCAGERRMGRGGPATLPPHGRRASDPAGLAAPAGLVPMAAVGAMSFLVLRSRSSRCQRLSAERPPLHATARSGPSSFPHPPPSFPRKETFAQPSFPHPPAVVPAPTHPPSFPRKRESMVGRGGGSPTQQQSKRHSPPKLPAGPPKQSIILFALSSFSIRKKRLDHHTKLNIQTRSGRPSRGLTRWPGEAYRASWPGGRPTHRPGGDSWQERKARSRGTCARRT